jgi:transposase
METVYVGIDISKATFDAALPQATGFGHLKLSNDQAGFEQLLAAAVSPCVFVMEASGPYYLRLAGFLHGRGSAVSVVNPLSVRRFCQMRLARAKTDKKDAVLIAQYAAVERPGLWQPEAGFIQELRQLQMASHGLEKTRQQHRRQLEALGQATCQSRHAAGSLERIVAAVEEEMALLDARMQQLAGEHCREQQRLLESVPGLGRKSSLLLIALTSGFTRFASAKQLIAYLGLSPRVYESGTSVKGKGRICKMGMARARAVLYVCSWSAVRCNKACRELYQRLREKGKAHRLALIAVVNKLIRQAFAVATKGQYYMEMA